MTKPQMEAVKAQGLNDPSDLFDMSKEDITRLFEMLKSRTYDATGTQLPTVVLTSRTVSRLHVCAEIVKYLSLVNRDITWSAITWTSAQIFKEEWKTIEEAAAAKATASPKSKNVPIMEWIYSFIDWTKATTGKNYCPLFYLIADEGDRDKTSPEDAPFLIPGHHFGGDRRSIKEEIMARVSTNTAAARSDNETLFDALCTSFAHSLLSTMQVEMVLLCGITLLPLMRTALFTKRWATMRRVGWRRQGGTVPRMVLCLLSLISTPSSLIFMNELLGTRVWMR
jgi:hypothetical protein